MRKLVYSVTFNRYTNCMRNAVAHNNKTLDYVDINPDVPFLIFEDEVEKYQQYGGGISHLICIGEMDITDDVRPQGEWIQNKVDRINHTNWKCSNCNCYYDVTHLFCPNCGAEMRIGEVNDSTTKSDTQL